MGIKTFGLHWGPEVVGKRRPPTINLVVAATAANAGVPKT